MKESTHNSNFLRTRAQVRSGELHTQQVEDIRNKIFEVGDWNSAALFWEGGGISIEAGFNGLAYKISMDDFYNGLMEIMALNL